ncbi:MAG TPA: nucleotidyltransferase domain-containing protein [Acidobacteriota bacterium]|nr:nucleotidyltransferase domain-containing protein [Acidobacteriota bacterium]
MNKQIISILKRTLNKEKYIEFAYIFGSFVKDKKHSDIDIGIFVSLPKEEEVFKITSDLKHKISRELNKKNIPLDADHIDIVVMNHINFKFLNNIFKQGVLILDRNPGLRTNEIEKNSNKVRECLGILKEAEIL